MLKLIPMPKSITYNSEILKKNKIKYCCSNLDYRVVNALKNIPNCEDGIELKIFISEGENEKYLLSVSNSEIIINAMSAKGAFYAVQTLRQILKNEIINCCCIKDEPDFAYRGFYHDVTRGRVPTVKTLKKLIDNMAYYKLNSLQIYVEHTYEFKEYSDSVERTGYYTAEEIKELDRYCIDNFIEFVPSLSTFGHLFELLQKDKYKHLRELDDFKQKEHMWYDRMQHHTIDPTNDESFEIIKSLLDQYMPLFSTDRFNICCDETFDLTNGKHSNLDTGKLYLDFVTKIISYLQSKGKKVMMWADIILQYPEYIDKIPNGVEFLNWYYEPDVPEKQIEKPYLYNRAHVVCPGVNGWSRFVENTKTSEKNISNMAMLGKKYEAFGVLNTNWGDWGHPCCIELNMYGMALGAEKSWNIKTEIDENFEQCADLQIYNNNGTTKLVKELSEIHESIDWNSFVKYYSNIIYEKVFEVNVPSKDVFVLTQKKCISFIDKIKTERWNNDEYRQQLVISAEAICLIAELWASLCGYVIERKINTKEWLAKFGEKWNENNKQCELFEIEKLFNNVENMI